MSPLSPCTTFTYTRNYGEKCISTAANSSPKFRVSNVPVSKTRPPLGCRSVSPVSGFPAITKPGNRRMTIRFKTRYRNIGAVFRGTRETFVSSISSDRGCGRSTCPSSCSSFVVEGCSLFTQREATGGQHAGSARLRHRGEDK